MEIKKHYKMFKAGKKWAYASIATAGLGFVAINANSTKVQADSKPAQNTTDQVKDNTKTSDVNAKTVTLNKNTANSSADTTSKATVAKTATSLKVEAKSDVKVTVASSAAPVNKTATKLTVSSSAASSAVASSATKVATKAVSSATVAPTSSAKSAVTENAVQKGTKAVTKSETSKKVAQKDYTIDNSHKLADNEGSDQKTNNNIIVAHATGTYAPAENVAIFEKREWDSDQTYVQYIVGDGGKVYAVGEEGYVAWGAGQWANENAPVQVELAQTYSDSQFKKDYRTYVELLRDSAKKYNIPTSLDSSAYRGIKSHVWISNNVWGDHVDPYGYLSSHGISKSQFAHDLAYGFGNDNAGNNNNNNNSNNNNSNTNNNSGKNDNHNSGNNNSAKVHVGSKVTIKTSAKRWATGQTIYSGVKGKTYKVIQMNGSRLLLDSVMSWINVGDVTVNGSNANGGSSNSGSHSNNNNNHNNSNNNHNNGNKNNGTIKVGSNVTIKTSAKRWATGQTIYSGVKGKTYKVIQINGNRLLLNSVMSWINKSDVTVPGASNNGGSSNSGSHSNNNNNHNNSNNNHNNSNKNNGTIKVGSNVTIKTSAKRWATGQTIYSGVKGKTYKVIQINGNRLLLNSVMSWINKSDVTVPGASNHSNSSNSNSHSNTNNNSNANKNNNTIKVGSKVTINTNAKRWATGQTIYSGVKGKTYKVIQINGNRLLLNSVMSWINKSDVTLYGSHSNNSNNSNGKANNNNLGYLTNSRWTAAQTKFVNSIAPDVVKVCNNNNLYASVAMAQAVLESAYGSSSLAQDAHNLFGIKADSTWKGATYTKYTQEVINGRTVTVKASFRKYNSFAESIQDYAKKLESRPQYANAFTNRADNYVEAIKAIKAGGYATATTYVASLVNCVNSNGFYKLDGLASAMTL